MERLIKIQQCLRVEKDKVGDKGRFKFRSAEDIFEKVKPLLEETKTAVVVSDTLVEVGGKLAIKATALLYAAGNGQVAIASADGYALMDKHEIVKRDTGELISTMSNEQCTGSASSYARKYALCGLFAIDNDESDPDQPDIKKAGTSPAPKQTLSKPTTQPKQEKPADAPKSVQKPASKPAKVEMTEEEKEMYLQMCSDLDAADKTASVLAICLMAEGQPYELLVRQKAARRGIDLATSLNEIKDAYSLIQGREGWEEMRAYSIEIVSKKNLQ